MRRVLSCLLLLALPAAARDPPACTPAVEGQVACMAGKLCECRFERGGRLTGRGDHFAWDCGALRPACPPDPTISQAPPALPPMNLWLQPRGGPMPPR